MAQFSLERFTVLVAEDNPYLRTLMLQSLKALGIGTVKTVNDGGGAIELLSLMKKDPMASDVCAEFPQEIALLTPTPVSDA